jgi:hypothetical protein
MSIRAFTFALALLPLALLAQAPVPVQATGTPNATMRAVLLANRPEHFTEQQWLRMMEQPVNRSLYPLRITQAMLDTLDAAKLEMRYQYMLVPENPQAR